MVLHFQLCVGVTREISTLKVTQWYVEPCLDITLSYYQIVMLNSFNSTVFTSPRPQKLQVHGRAHKTCDVSGIQQVKK